MKSAAILLLWSFPFFSLLILLVVHCFVAIHLFTDLMGPSNLWHKATFIQGLLDRWYQLPQFCHLLHLTLFVLLVPLLLSTPVAVSAAAASPPFHLEFLGFFLVGATIGVAFQPTHRPVGWESRMPGPKIACRPRRRRQPSSKWVTEKQRHTQGEKENAQIVTPQPVSSVSFLQSTPALDCSCKWTRAREPATGGSRAAKARKYTHRKQQRHKRARTQHRHKREDLD